MHSFPFFIGTLITFSSAAPITQVIKRNNKPSQWRGVVYTNSAQTNLFRADDSKIHWCYNWDSKSNGANTAYEFVPMLWGLGDNYTPQWIDNVDEAVKAGSTHLMAFNEPDQCGGGGSCMDPTTSAAGYKQWMQPLHDKYHGVVHLGSPSVTNGPPPMGFAWLRNFMEACSECTVDFVNIHWYDSALNFAYFKQYIQDAKQFGKPIWITEMGASGSDEQIEAFFKQALPFLDAEPMVWRYTYTWSLTNGDRLSAVGNAFNTW